jgi:3-hydroxyisobutyrate dehydrogenase-like beta-hydroxyacid dehydrogenase
VSRVAIIGTGVQGTAVAARLLAAGHALVVHDLVAAHTDEARALGAAVAASAPAAVAGAEVVLLVVTAGPAPRRVLLEPGVAEALAAGQLVVQMGSLGVEDTRACRRLVQARGARFVSNILHGVRQQILEGSVLMLFGGSEDEHRETSTLLAPVGVSVAVGTPEQAAAFNAAGLLLLYAILHGYALGSAIAEREGIAAEVWGAHVRGAAQLMEVMTGFFGPAHFATRSYELVGPCRFKNDGAVEEVKILRDLVGQLGLDTQLVDSLVEAHRSAYLRHPRADFSSVYEELAPPLPAGSSATSARR